MYRAVVLLCLFLLYGLTAVAQDVRDGVLIDTIIVRGNKITRRSVILRELPVKEGRRIPTDSVGYYIALSKLRLLNVGLFTSVEISMRPAGGKTIQILLDVGERFYLIPKPIFQLADRNFNVWWDEMHRDIRRINAGIKLTNNNFRGNLESLSVTVQAGYTQRLVLEYIRPYLDRAQQHGLGIAASISQSGEIPYKTDSNKLRFARLPGSGITRQYGAGITWYYRPRFSTRHSLTLAGYYVQIADTVVRLNAEYFGSRRNRLSYIDLTYRLDYNGVDNWNYPLQGTKSVHYLILRKGIEGLGWQAQWRTETGIFSQLKPKWYGEAILRGRLSVPDDVPYFLQSALGTKTDYVRGYEYYVIDGTHYGLLRLDFKREIFNRSFRKLGLRYLPELPLRIYPKLFADAGIAHNPYPGNSFLHDCILYAAGVGVDVVSAYDFKLRLEAAVNQLGQYGVYLHLNSE